MLNEFRQCADRISNNGSLNTSVCGRLARRHSPQTKMTICPDAAYFETCSQKVPGRALVVFLSAYTKQGSGGRAVGTWALKGFSEAALTGTALPRGLMVGGPGHNGVKSAQCWWIYITVLLYIHLSVLFRKRKVIWVSTTHGACIQKCTYKCLHGSCVIYPYHKYLKIDVWCKSFTSK